MIIPQSGTVRQVTIAGRKADTLANLRSFDDTMQSNVGGNKELTYQTGSPGTSHKVMVSSYESTFNAGAPGTLEYAMTLFEGLSIGS